MPKGTHSMLAYSGFLAGHKYVRDVMADPAIAGLVSNHLASAAATLGDLPGADLETYAKELALRLENPHPAHATYQIAMDGSEQMPRRQPMTAKRDRADILWKDSDGGFEPIVLKKSV